MINNTSNFNISIKPKNIGFQRQYNSDKVLAEDVVRYVRGLHLESSSAIAHRHWCLARKGVYMDRRIREGVDGVRSRVKDQIDFIRDIHGTPERFISDGVGNCGEMAIIAYNELRERGFNDIDIVAMYIEKNNSGPYERVVRPFKDHVVVVSRLNKARKNKAGNPVFDINRPNTWGNEAIIIDPWTGVVDGVQPGLMKIKQFLQIGDHEKLIFREKTKDFINTKI